MNNKVMKNPEFKNIIIKALVIFLISNLMVVLYSIYNWKKLSEEITNRNISIIGNVINKNPKIENDVIEALTGNLSSINIENGREIAEKYGYTSELHLNVTPSINKFYKNSIKISLLISTATFLALIYALYIIFKKFYTNINQLSIGAEKIVEGNFTLKFSEENEGEISKLGFQFNQMSKRLQSTLEQLREERTFLKNMISDISHQLKTPLTSLRMFNELLIDGAFEEPEVRDEFLQKSFVQLDRMEWLIHTLLKMARLETGVIELNKKDRNLTKTIKDEINSLKIRVDNKNQKFKLRNLDNPIYLSHDSKWIGEALRNIIKNAIDYTPRGGEIFVSMEKTNSLIILEIRDTGIGISKNDIPHIFERFYQGKNSQKITKTGTGIGLSITKVIIEKHNGTIEVNSQENKGTTFTIIFPRI